jgi:hypothetical protein
VKHHAYLYIMWKEMLREEHNDRKYKPRYNVVPGGPNLLLRDAAGACRTAMTRELTISAGGPPGSY